MSDLYTCITCRVAFKDSDIQRQHYKSDWHRYNLKRKVAELAPVVAEEFVNRILAQRDEKEESAKDKSKYCNSCRKSFNNENSYSNHLNSKKHKENVNKEEEEIDQKVPKSANKVVELVIRNAKISCSDSEYEEVDSDEWDEDFDNPAVNHICLFCIHKSRNLIRNLRHMSLAHSFFIPDVEFCINMQGLINYLGEKIYQGFMCLWCSEFGKSFHSAEAVQRHMQDKGHCKMLHEGPVLLEYTDFYDYSSSYPNDENADIDEEIDVKIIDDTDYQLVLPSGAVIGHRSLARYYKQKLNPNSSVAVVNKSGKTLHRVLAQYRALGWTENKPEQVVKKVRDIKYMHRIENKWATNLSIKANKLQKHFRQQVNF